uniref:Uncharacterized protein n=1 Tax=Pelusios castaneus TaxID=367368 RepID=A0A8C8SNV9_9SAUR
LSGNLFPVKCNFRRGRGGDYPALIRWSWCPPQSTSPVAAQLPSKAVFPLAVILALCSFEGYFCAVCLLLVKLFSVWALAPRERESSSSQLYYPKNMSWFDIVFP